MKRIIASLLILYLCLIAVNAFAEEFIIRGYESGQFAAKGSIEKDLAAVIDKLKKQNGNTILNILVVGSADQTGNSSANEMLSRYRAEEVAAILSFNFSKAKINVASKGDFENVRQVKILSESIPVSLTVSSISTKKDWASGLIALTAFILLALAFLIRKARKKIIANHFTLKKKETNVWISMKVNGKFYKYIPLLNDEGKMISPFIARNGEKYAFEKSDEGRRGLRNSVVSALKKDALLFNQEKDAGRLIEIGSVEKPV
jgi:hypothetical protein